MITTWSFLCDRSSRIETERFREKRFYCSKQEILYFSEDRCYIFYKTARDAQKLREIKRRNGYVLDYRHLLLLLWDVRFNQTVYRPASDRNTLPGGNGHQENATPAEDIFDFSQDSGTPRLLPAINRRAFDSGADIIPSEVVQHLLVWESEPLCVGYGEGSSLNLKRI